MEQNVFYTLSGDTPGGFARVFFKIQPDSTVPMNQFPCKQGDVQMLRVLLSRDSPSLILLHGEPGTGKSEFAKALATSVGKTSVFLNFESAHKPQAQLSLLAMSSRFQDPATQVVVVDEADNLLNTAYQTGSDDAIDKGILNTFFDEFRGKAIFISNTIAGIERSVLRRFHFTLPFKSFNPQARQRVWANLGERLPVFTPSQLAALATTYEANPAQIKNTLEISMDLKNSGFPDESVLASAKGLLETSQRLLWGTRPQSFVHGNGTYALDWLNTDADPQQLVGNLCRWKEDLEAGGTGIGVLFNGPPGTGKTLFGRYLAMQIGLPLACKKASDLISPYVGETECNIRDAFEASDGGVLMIDEADTFFMDRSKAQRSWERSQTNEILQALENFRGLFIATTNFQQVFDEASFRRFSFKVAFLPLKPDQRVSLLQGFFPTVEWSDQDFIEVARLEGLTPGDVAAVQKRLKYGPKSSTTTIIDELQKDLRVRGCSRSAIGFQGN